MTILKYCAGTLLWTAAAIGNITAAFGAPSVKFVEGQLVAPTATPLGTSTTRTTSVPGYVAPEEISALSKGLGAGNLTATEYTQRVYEYVRQNIEVEFRYGLGKGALGALIDQSGTPFDQAELMVELLRAGGVTASYKVGTATLSADQVGKWTGLVTGLNESAQTFTVDKKAICKLFADGGIPASFSGSSSATCAYTGNLTGSGAVVISHIWVNTGGVDYDPSFKEHTLFAGLNLGSAMGCASTCASELASIFGPTGSTGGADSKSNINEDGAGGIHTELAVNAEQLITTINALSAPPEIEQVIGGKVILDQDPIPNFAGGLPYTTGAATTWTGDIPNAYRATVRLEFANAIDETYFVDEIAGERLRLLPAKNKFGAPASAGIAELFLGSRKIADGGTTATSYNTGNRFVRFTVNYPYPATSGAADETITLTPQLWFQRMNDSIFAPMALIVGVGRQGEGYERRIADKVTAESLVETNDGNGGCSFGYKTCSSYNRKDDLFHTSKDLPIIAAKWMAEGGRTTGFISGITKAAISQHISVGYVESVDTGLSVNTPINVHSRYSISQSIVDTTQRRAAAITTAAALSALEGGVVRRQYDSPFSTSAIGGFHLANLVDPDGGAVPPNSTYRTSGLTFLTLTTPGQENTLLDAAAYDSVGTLYKGYLADRRSYIGSLLSADFDVIVPKEGEVGRIWSPWNVEWNIIPIIAIKPDRSEVAFITMNADGPLLVYKGGGSNLPYAVDPLTTAIDAHNSLKSPASRFPETSVDTSSGVLKLTPSPDIVTGSGDFPYSLAFQRTYTSSPAADGLGQVNHQVSTSTDIRVNTDVYRDRTLGWSHNFQITAVSGSDAWQGLGDDSANDAAAAIAALYAAYQLNISTVAGDEIRYWLTTALAMNWFEESLYDNVITVAGGPIPGAYVRSPNRARFLPPNGTIADLVQTGAKAPPPFVQTLGDFRWDHSGVTYGINFRDGQSLFFTHRLSGQKYDRGLGAESWTNSIAGVDVTLTWGANAKFVSEVANSLGRKIIFTYGAAGAPSAPMLRSVEDENGRTASFNYTFVSSKLTNSESGETQGGTAWFNKEYDRVLTISSVTDAEGNITNYGYGNLASPAHDDVDVQLVSYFRPSNPAAPFYTFTYDEQQRPLTFKNAIPDITKYFTGSISTERRRRGYVVDPTGAKTIAYYNDQGQPVEEIDGVGERSFKTYDGIGRLTTATAPEGNAVKYRYDSRHKIIEERKVAKPGSGLADIVMDFGWEFPSGIHRMKWSDDAMGRRTDYIYDSSNRLTQIQQPLINGVRPTKIIGYQSFAGIGSFVSSIQEPDGIKSCFTYDAANKYALKTATASCQATTGLNLVTTLTTNARGDVTVVDGPRTGITDTTTFEFDNLRRPTAKIDALGNRVEASIDEDGLLEYVREKTGATTWATTSFTYDGAGRLYRTTDPDGFQSYQWYDPAGRPLVAQDAAGRKTRTVYDAAGRVDRLIKAWAGTQQGTGATVDCAVMRADTAADPAKLQQCYQGFTYMPNGQVWTTYDANGNITAYQYDGHDRNFKIRYPNPSGGGSSTTDFEQFTFDANGNILTKRARDGHSITYSYDPLSRLTQRIVPGSGDAPGVEENFDFTYDLAGRQLTNYHQAVTIRNVYDGAGRLKEKTHDNAQPISYLYDEAGNVINLTYPDDYDVSFAYDELNRVVRACEVIAPGKCRDGTVPAAILADVSYDLLSRRKSVDYRNGTSADYAYSARGDLLCHDWNLTGTAPASCNAGSPEIAYDFSYNPVGQLLTEAVSDPLLAWSPAADLNETWEVNGLNQYTQIARTPHGGAATTSPVTHSANGNVEIDDRGWSYVYSAENQLMTVHAPGSVLKGSYKYYGDGTRRFKDSAGAPIARFFYDGDQEIAEYDQPNTGLIRRYVRLPGSVDEPFLMIDYSLSGSCTISNPGAAAPCERWAHQNRLGSVVAVTASTGAVVERHQYGPYGEVGGSTSGFPFRFTGQKLDAETGLYYYKARYYDPAFGRFLQTDPIGYEDQMNLYAYGPNDPTNGRDVTGEVWGKAIRLVVKVAKYKGNVRKAVKETAAEVGQAAAALTDGKIDVQDAVAVFDLVSPVSMKEVKAGTKTVKSAAQARRSASSPDSRPPADPIGDAKRAGEANGLKGLAAGAVTGSVSGGYVGYQNDGMEGAILGAVYGGFQGSIAGFVGAAVSGSGAGGAVAGFVASGILNFGHRNTIDQATKISAEKKEQEESR